MTAPIILDVSRLLSRAAHRVPTGIERVEHAYAETLLTLARDRLRYAAMHPLGRFAGLPTARARHFVALTGQLWQQDAGDAAAGRLAGTVRGMARRLQAGMMLPRIGPGLPPRGGGEGRATYLLTSHHHLHQPEAIRTAQRRLGATFVCFIHDLIPIEFPEFVRPHGAAKHRLRIETAARLADGIVVNSAATRDALLPFIGRAGRSVPVLVAPLGVPGAVTQPRREAVAHPYFVCVGTIEPRKNHLLLLNVWRRLVQEMGERAPHLVLIGQRGWGQEMTADVLERSVTLQGHIVEFGDLPDEKVATLIAGARALLMPSFAEGYGLPVAEALAAGTPVLCSDLPALREVGGGVPEFLDPLDGPGWHAAIREYHRADSARRAAQMSRLASWSPPGWTAHLEAVLGLIDGLRPR